MTATLSIGRAPEVAVDARVYVVDCPHGTTEGLVLPGRAGLPAALIVRSLLRSHDAHEGCRCTRRLWRRYAA
jgi:hypothetical protein